MIRIFLLAFFSLNAFGMSGSPDALNFDKNVQEQAENYQKKLEKKAATLEQIKVEELNRVDALQIDISPALASHKKWLKLEKKNKLNDLMKKQIQEIFEFYVDFILAANDNQDSSFYIKSVELTTYDDLQKKKYLFRNGTLYLGLGDYFLETKFTSFSQHQLFEDWQDGLVVFGEKSKISMLLNKKKVVLEKVAWKFLNPASQNYFSENSFSNKIKKSKALIKLKEFIAEKRNRMLERTQLRDEEEFKKVILTTLKNTSCNPDSDEPCVVTESIDKFSENEVLQYKKILNEVVEDDSFYDDMVSYLIARSSKQVTMNKSDVLRIGLVNHTNHHEISVQIDLQQNRVFNQAVQGGVEVEVNSTSERKVRQFGLVNVAPDDYVNLRINYIKSSINMDFYRRAAIIKAFQVFNEL